jgi:hypothetical protein
MEEVLQLLASRHIIARRSAADSHNRSSFDAVFAALA